MSIPRFAALSGTNRAIPTSSGPCCASLSPPATGPKHGISIRNIRGVSGHNGEQWSAIAGGLGRLLELGDTASAAEAQAVIETEIDREQAVFDHCAAERDAELDVLRLSMTLAHNRGDLTQGMGFWKRTPVTGPVMDHLSDARPLHSRRARLSAHRAFRRRPPTLPAAFRQGPAPLPGHPAAPLPVPRRMGRRHRAPRR